MRIWVQSKSHIGPRKRHITEEKQETQWKKKRKEDSCASPEIKSMKIKTPSDLDIFLLETRELRGHLIEMFKIVTTVCKFAYYTSIYCVALLILWLNYIV